MLRVGFVGKALLEPKYNGMRYYWNPLQIKVTIPEEHFDECVLTDEDEDIDAYFSDKEAGIDNHYSSL
jgi:hypothetical protein